jgi:hypothetical protein
MKRLALSLLLVALPSAAMAARWRVDALLFLNPPSAVERGSTPRHPDNDRAISLDDVQGLAYAGISVLPEEADTLAGEWATLRANRRYKPLLRLSWIQQDPPAQHGPALRLYLPSGRGGLEGWLRLEARRGMALVADLEYVQPKADGNLDGYRLQVRQPMSNHTLHYLDSTRLGVLARVSPLP